MFLEQFVEACRGQVHMSSLEDCFQYTILRTTYIQLHEAQTNDYHAIRSEE